MDRRIVFFLVFSFTLFSTLLVAFVCFLTNQTIITSTLYTVVTMWVTGIVSQLLLHNLYQSIVAPLDNEKEEELEEEHAFNYDDIEEIDQVKEIAKGKGKNKEEKEKEGEEKVKNQELAGQSVE